MTADPADAKLLPPVAMRQLEAALSEIRLAADKLENVGIVCGDLDRAIEKLIAASNGDATWSSRTQPAPQGEPDFETLSLVRQKNPNGCVIAERRQAPDATAIRDAALEEAKERIVSFLREWGLPFGPRGERELVAAIEAMKFTADAKEQGR